LYKKKVLVKYKIGLKKYLTILPIIQVLHPKRRKQLYKVKYLSNVDST